jgi:hypothetical protein
MDERKEKNCGFRYRLHEQITMQLETGIKLLKYMQQGYTHTTKLTPRGCTKSILFFHLFLSGYFFEFDLWQ